MDEEDIKEIAQSVYDQNQTSDQFAVAQTGYHTHNGTDSQKITFIGLSDVPTSYYGNKGRTLIVSPSEKTLEFTSGTVATTAKDGFLAIPHCAGTPTGTPSVGAGAMVYDTSANKLWIYNGSAWKSVALT